jgi:hypothetical protein
VAVAAAERAPVVAAAERAPVVAAAGAAVVVAGAAAEAGDENPTLDRVVRACCGMRA